MPDRHRRVRSAAVTGVGQLLGLLGSALIGVLVAGTLKPSPRVDAFFAANQIYALALYLGQAVRITAPALMVRSGLEPVALKRATSTLAVGTVACLLGVALLGRSLVAPSAGEAFASDLLVLAPAAGVHVVAGGLAARMSVVGSFGFAAAAYAAGSITSGFLLLLSIDRGGASALAPCIAAGGLTIGAIMFVSYRRVLAHAPQARESDLVVGPGPRRADLRRRPTAPFALRRIGLGAVPALALQLLTTVTTVAAGHVVSGGTALLSYSFLALFAFTTIAITPMSIVLGPEVAERWTGGLDDLEAIVTRATGLSVVIVVPLVVLGFLIGRPLADLVLTALDDHDLDQVFEMLGILCPSLLFTAAATAATVGVTAADRLGRLAIGLGLVAGLAVCVGVTVALTSHSLILVAGLATTLAVTYSIVTLFIALPGRAVGTIASIVKDNALVIAPAVAATASLATSVEHHLSLGLLFGLCVTALHVTVVALLKRDTVSMLVGAARRRPVAQ